MKKFYSISKYPGNTGKYFYSNFFQYYNIDAEYIPLGSDNFKQTFDEILSFASGISVSMPFKQEAIKFVDIKSLDVLKYDSCNTLTVKNNLITGNNCDLEGVKYFCNLIDQNFTVGILGNGCMGKMFFNYLDLNKKNIYSRSLYNWSKRHDESEVIINCTSLGTSSFESPLEFISDRVKLIFDLSLGKNDLQNMCFENNINYVNGIEFYKAQFAKQFELYTNISLDIEYFDYLLKNKI